MRRIKCDLSMYFKILYDLVYISPDSLFHVRNVRTRNNGLTLYKEKFNNNLKCYVFRNRCLKVWNLLPQNVVCSNDLASFIYNLNSIDLVSIIRKASVSA